MVEALGRSTAKARKRQNFRGGSNCFNINSSHQQFVDDTFLMAIFTEAKIINKILQYYENTSSQRINRDSLTSHPW